MVMEENRVCFIRIPGKKSRSVSPLTPSHGRERNVGFVRALTRRFRRRSHDYLVYNGEDDSGSSSTDSCSSTSGNLRQSRTKERNSNLELSCHSSDASSSGDETEKNSMSHSRLSRRATIAIRQALQNFSIPSKSVSRSTTPSTDSKKNKVKNQPQRILRQPVAYTYLKGISGLPTQRVPRTSVCCNFAHR